MDPMDDDVVPNAYGSGFDIVPSLPSGVDATQRHEQAIAQVAAMDPRVASEVYQQVLDSGGSVSLQEATQATLAGMPSATVMGVPTVNNTLAMTRFNVVNVHTASVDEALRRELHQHEFQLSEQARREAELEALRFRLYEREASVSIAATKVAAELAVQNVQQLAQQNDNVAIRRLQATLEEQREHFQQRLAQATMAHDKAVRERDALATNCSEGNMYLEKLKSEHRQYVEQNETRFKAAAEATEQARCTAAEDASKVIDLEFKRDELTSSLAIAQAKVRTLSSEIEAVKKQSSFDKELQKQTIVELRRDNAMLKGEMDELRQMVQALSNANKEAERKAQTESPAKPGPLHPEPPLPEEKPESFPVGQPLSLGPLRTEGSVPATVDGSPPDLGGIPVKTAMGANASKRNTGFPSMFSGTGAAAAEKPSASTEKRKLDTPDPWAEYRKKSEKEKDRASPETGLVKVRMSQGRGTMTICRLLRCRQVRLHHPTLP